VIKNYYHLPSVTPQRANIHGVDGIFTWTIFIFLLMGFALFCWMGSFYIFGHPEKAGNYRLLMRLHKLEEPQRFALTEAPRGEFLKPQQLLERFAPLTQREIKRFNDQLLANFLRNYHQTHDLTPYVTQTYRVLATFPLNKKHFLYPGVCSLLQSVDQPEIFLEQLFSTASDDTSSLEQTLTSGQEIKFEKPLDLSAILYIEKLPEERLKLTTISLLYGSYGPASSGPILFSLTPPNHLNLESGLPLLSPQDFRAAEEQYQAYLKQSGFSNSGELKSALQPNTPSLLQIVSNKSTSSTTTSSFKKSSSKNIPRTAKALPVTTSSTTNTPTAQAEPMSAPKVARAIALNTTAVLPAIPVNHSTSSTERALPPTAEAAKTPTQQPLTRVADHNQAVSPLPPQGEAAPLENRKLEVTDPFSAAIALQKSSPSSNQPLAETTASSLSSITTSSTPATDISSSSIPTTDTTSSTAIVASPIPSTNSGIWPLYEPGKTPHGRFVEASRLADLVEQGVAGEPLYVQGDFAVTASGADRSVLRYQGKKSSLPPDRIAKTRIIVAYPTGIAPPREGTLVTRAQDCPLMITDVKKGGDGSINIYAREIIR
jgi:hypothetical protein